MKRKWLFKDYYDTTIILLALISVILVLLGFDEMIDLDNLLKENGALFLEIFLIYWLFSL